MSASLLRIALPALAAIGLAACSGMQAKSSYVPEPKPPSVMDEDEAYIAHVERIARQRGIEVRWVNLPRKSSAQVAREIEQR
ncbi:hypothetical protein [Vulcaniibacterium tengchongense]|uniref:Lipoprotein n=1 Tax=Vulcaniibacterium tengchongense TaxID=1273429 RepID=A0A3N4V726_9GAMM|nr:hypothetical protein [Vulcaniibacterium tengchongense]RPE77155.1 hypothetical protein EDC50_2414 [Vulcaniibacterium tengchongense]